MCSPVTSLTETVLAEDELFAQFFIEGKPLCLKSTVTRNLDTFLLAVVVDGPHMVTGTAVRSNYRVYPPHHVVAWINGSYYIICEIKVTNVDKRKLQYRVTRVLSPALSSSYEPYRKVGKWRDNLSQAMAFHGYGSNIQHTGLNNFALRYLLRRAMSPKMSPEELILVEPVPDDTFRVVNDPAATWLAEDPIVKAVRERQFRSSAPPSPASAPPASVSLPIPAAGGVVVTYPSIPLSGMYWPMLRQPFPMMPWVCVPIPFKPVATGNHGQTMPGVAPSIVSVPTVQQVASKVTDPADVDQSDADEVLVVQPMLVGPVQSELTDGGALSKRPRITQIDM